MLSKIMAQLTTDKTIARFRLRTDGRDIDRRIANIKLMARIGPGYVDREEPLSGRYSLGREMSDGTRIVHFGPYESSNGYSRREVPITTLEEALETAVLPASRRAKLEFASPEPDPIKIAVGAIGGFELIWPERNIFPPDKNFFRGQEAVFASFGSSYHQAKVKMVLYFKSARWDLRWNGYRLAEMSSFSTELNFVLGSRDERESLSGWQVLNAGAALFCKRLAEAPFFLRPGGEPGSLAINIDAAENVSILEHFGLTEEGTIDPLGFNC